LVPGAEEPSPNTLDDAIQCAIRALDQDDFELTPFIAALLEDVRAAGFERVVFGFMNENFTCMRGRLASGDAVDEILHRFQFSLDGVPGPLIRALLRKEDIFIDRARGDHRYDSSALVTAFDPGLFALFPIVIESKTAGCLYADIRQAHPGLDQLRPALARVRDIIASAIRKKAQPEPVCAAEP